MDTRQRIIQELVPGKQITLAHIIANPDGVLIDTLGIPWGDGFSAIGIMTVTPPETTIIIADIAIKAAGVKPVFVDMVSGSLIVTGSVSAVESAINAVLDYIGERLGFEICKLTKT